MRLREGVFLNITQRSRSFADSATTDSANHDHDDIDGNNDTDEFRQL